MTQLGLTEGITVITLDNGPLNTLALPLRRQLNAAFLAACDDPQVRAIVLTGKGRGFSGGGDITEFDTAAIHAEPTPAALFALIENAAKPVVAALHGLALGGGLELALACHARVAHAQTRIGLPEVTLGLVPGAGGTQRLPRLVGLELALNLIVQGQILAASALQDSGLLDAVTDEPPLATAIAQARALATRVAEGRPLPRSADRRVGMPNAQAFLAYARAGVQATYGDRPAPAACIDCLEKAVTTSFAEGMAFEAKTFLWLRSSAEFAGLRHAFLSDRAATHVPGLTSEPHPIERTAVLGAGTMGTGIAMSLADAGLPVLILEQDQAALERGLAAIRNAYEGPVKKGRMTEEEAARRIARIEGTLHYEALGEADLIIEAVFEDMDVKGTVFARLDAVAKPGAILASNTSMLDLDQIAAFTTRPRDVVGLHFFSPAHVMKLLEVVRGAATAPDVLASALEFAKRIGKTAVVSGVCEGFIGNRMLEAYLTQAGLLLDEGALPQQVDRAMEAWGMAMGPFRVCDLAGNDLSAKIRAARKLHTPDLIYSRSFDAIVEMGRFGQKVEKGWYDYLPAERAPRASADVTAAIEAESRRLGRARRGISDGEIVDRLTLALVNEGAKILDEGIALRASDIDVVYTAGYGFPRWRGGPMFAADRRGLGDVLDTMERLASNAASPGAAALWRPAPLIQRLAISGASFATLTLSETF